MRDLLAKLGVIGVRAAAFIDEVVRLEPSLLARIHDDRLGNAVEHAKALEACAPSPAIMQVYRNRVEERLRPHEVALEAHRPGLADDLVDTLVDAATAVQSASDLTSAQRMLVLGPFGRAHALPASAFRTFHPGAG